MWVGSTADAFSERRFKDRVRFLSFFFIFGFSIIVLRLFYLQVIRGDDFALVSESNRTQTIFLGAPRGNFYDRTGRQLVTNRPRWAMMYSGAADNNITEEQLKDRLSGFLAGFPTRWEKRFSYAFQNKKLVRLLDNVPSPIAFGVREMGDLLPGLRMEMEFRRDYPSGVPGMQLLGYLSEIDEKELKRDYWFARKPGDLIGKMGLEKILDSQLRGQDGGMLIEVDSIGRLKRVIKELPYRRGSSIQLTLDSNVQRAANEALIQTPTGRGAVVMMDIKTGEIISWVSAPTFNPNESLAKFVLDPDLPFFDRVYKGAYPPGSIYKMISMLAGFEQNQIRLKDKIMCEGFVILKDKRLKERKYGCWMRHGKVDFWSALTESCDSYFYLLAQRIGSQSIFEMSERFGLGKKVQSLLPHENAGTIPNPSWKRKMGLGGWSTGDSLNMSIGQGYVTSTPLQMVVMMAGLMNKGLIPRPFLIQRIFNEDGGTSFKAPVSPTTEVEIRDPNAWDYIVKALKMTVDSGTGRAAYVPYLDVYGKTGTAQNPHGEDHAWFLAAGGYPGEEPKYAVCIFVENGGGGGAIAAPIAKKVFEAALPPRTEEKSI